MSRLSKHERTYVDAFAELDSGLIGGSIGQGNSYHVFEYGQGDKVLKIPKHRSSVLGPTGAEQQRDCACVAEYFPQHTVPTTVHVSDRGSHCIVQDHVKGRPLTTHEDAAIRRQLQDIFVRNRALVRSLGLSLDFLGYEGVHRCLDACIGRGVGSSRVDLQACKLEYSIVSPK